MLQGQHLMLIRRHPEAKRLRSCGRYEPRATRRLGRLIP